MKIGNCFKVREFGGKYIKIIICYWEFLDNIFFDFKVSYLFKKI